MLSYNTTPLQKNSPNARITIADAVAIITGGCNAHIRDAYTAAYNAHSSPKSGVSAQDTHIAATQSAKREIEALKKGLPAFQISGYQSFGHGKTPDFEYNGAVQLDIDCKFEGGETAARLLKKQLFDYFDSIAWVALSPTWGVKAMFLTTNTDKDKHETVARGVGVWAQAFLNKTKPVGYEKMQIDYCEAHKICFVPYDKLALVGMGADLVAACGDTLIKIQTAYESNLAAKAQDRPRATAHRATAHRAYSGSGAKSASGLQKTVSTLLTNIANAPIGQRHHTRLSCARALAGYNVAIESVIAIACAVSDNPTQAEKDIRDAYAHGLNAPLI